MSREQAEDVDVILERLVGAQLDGLRPDIDEVAAQHPELAEQIRSRWLVLQSLRDDVGPLLQGPAVRLREGASFGDFQIIREIGRGGMGVVYEAEQQVPSRRVALKVLSSETADPLRTPAIFHREINALARLKHVGIAAILHAVDGVEKRHAFAMELVEGDSLLEYCRNRSLADRLDVFQRICEAVAYAHQRGVIHRDIKPSNILVTDGGQPKVLDFGLARLIDNEGAPITQSIDRGRIQGTLQYMSPEQATGDSGALDVRTDVYSLGVVLFEVLTGRTFIQLDGKSVTECIRVICEARPVEPSRFDSRLKGDLDVITLKAVEKAPLDRYQSISELSEDLSRYRQFRPIRAKPTKTYVRILKAIRRRPMRAALATLILLLAALAVPAVDGYRSSQAEKHLRLLGDLREKALLSVHLLTHPAETPLDPARRDHYQSVAESSLSAVMKAEPSSAWPYLMRARLNLADREKHPLVQPDLEMTEKLEPGYASPRLMRFYLNSQSEGLAPSDGFDWDSAPYPTEFDDLFFCGMYSHKLFDADRARTFLSAAVGLRPEDYWARLERARVTPMSMSDDRVADARLCTQLRPDLSPGWMLLQGWLHLSGATDESNDILDAMLDRFPADYHIVLTYAERYEQLGHFSKAESVLRSVLGELDSDVLRGTLGKLLARQGRWDEAVGFLESAIADCSSGWCDVWIAALATCLRDRGDIDGACDLLYARGDKIDGGDVSFRSLLARMELERGNRERALELFFEELEAEKHRPWAVTTVVPEIVQLLEQVGRRVEVRELLERELGHASDSHGELSSPAKQIRKQLLRWLWKQGELDRIDDILSAHITANASSPEPYIEAGQFFEEIGRTGDGIKAYSLGLGQNSHQNTQQSRFLRAAIARGFAQTRSPIDSCIQYSLARALDLECDTHDREFRLDWAGLLLDDARWDSKLEQQLGKTLFFRAEGIGKVERERIALEILDEQIQLVGESIRAEHYRARAHWRKGDSENALLAYETAMQCACRHDVRDTPEDWNERYSPGFAQQRRRLLRDYAQFLFDREQSAEGAIMLCRRAVDEFVADSAKGSAHVVLAELLVKNNDHEAAIESASIACELLPTDEDAWIILGDANWASGNRTAAVDAWVSAMEHSLGFSAVDPKVIQALIVEGRGKGDYDRAYRIAMRFFKSRRMPNVDTATADNMRIIDLFYLVSVCAHVGRGDEAVEHLKEWYKTTVACGGINEERTRQLTMMQGFAEKNGQAVLIDECERIQKELGIGTEETQAGDAFVRSGSMLLVLGKLDLAKSMFQESYRRRIGALGFRHVKTVISLECLAHVCNIKGDWLEAETYANGAIGTIEAVLDSDHPRLLDPLGQLALAMWEQGKIEPAEDASNRAIRIFRSSGVKANEGVLSALEVRGMIELKCGSAESAKALIQEALDRRHEQYKIDDEALAHTESLLGECLLELGRLEEAERLLDNSIPRMLTDTPLKCRRWERASRVLLRVRTARNCP